MILCRHNIIRRVHCRLVINHQSSEAPFEEHVGVQQAVAPAQLHERPRRAIAEQPLVQERVLAEPTKT